jgi:hypothetical protein
MAFLFKSKKNADKAQATKEGGVAGSVSSLQSSNGRIAQNEKGAAQQTTPGSSVNNSMNSLQGGGTSTPSPEQLNGRRGPSSEQVQDPNVSPRIYLLMRAMRIWWVGFL